jgi:tRNA threonylcarbamoyladenosine modification (KEOPS) complex  Pcc1 subunit
MKEADIKKVVELQGKIIKLRDRIMKDVARHNQMVCDELRPMSEKILHNTIYQVGDMTYRRGRIFCQLDCDDFGLGIKAEGLATLRRIVVEDNDAASDKQEGGPSASVSE